MHRRIGPRKKFYQSATGSQASRATRIGTGFECRKTIRSPTILSILTQSRVSKSWQFAASLALMSKIITTTFGSERSGGLHLENRLTLDALITSSVNKQSEPDWHRRESHNTSSESQGLGFRDAEDSAKGNMSRISSEEMRGAGELGWRDFTGRIQNFISHGMGRHCQYSRMSSASVTLRVEERYLSTPSSYAEAHLAAQHRYQNRPQRLFTSPFCH